MALAKNSMEGKAKDFLKQIENINAELDSLKADYMNDCKSHREDIKQVYTDAKDAGVPPKALRGLVKKRSLEKKAAAIADGFDIDDAAAYATLCEALGDLGKAAAKAAGHATNGAADDDADLRGTAQKQADKERADEAALAQVGQG